MPTATIEITLNGITHTLKMQSDYMTIKLEFIHFIDTLTKEMQNADEG